MPRATAFLLLTACSFSTCLQAHEYWLAPITPVVKVGNEALIDVKNGEEFSGVAYPYNPERVKSISIIGEKNTRDYVGRLGDYPAIRPKLIATGIHSIAIETNAQKLTYSSWEKFTAFLEYHGFTDVLERHIERKLPKIDVTENYTRSAKTFLQVMSANSQGQFPSSDKSTPNHNAYSPVGHEFEMILLESPFDNTSAVRLKLLFKGKPLAGRQVEMFWKGNESVRVITTSNADGIATFEPLGEGDYLLNAVHLTEPKDNEVHWASHWASVTFKN